MKQGLLLNRLRLIVCAFVLFCKLAAPARAYVFISTPPPVWPAGEISMDVQLGSTLDAPLQDGSTSFNAVVASALAEWNQRLTTVEFVVATGSPTTPTDGDGINQVFFDSTIYGLSFDDALAVTTVWSFGNERTEGDVIFNSAYKWDSYRGRVKPSAYDLKRTALHEFGHVLGLDHPDEAGQRVAAIMNSAMTDLDRLTADDGNGAFALYGGAPSIIVQPKSQTVLAGASVTFSVLVAGVPPFDYQWLFNGEPIEGAKNSSYFIERVQSAQAGSYSVSITNSYGLVTSVAATLAIDSSTAFGVIGVPFFYRIIANNNPTWFSASGLPHGLSCDDRTGLISGTPTRVGIYSVRVKAGNDFTSVSATVSFTIAEGAIISPNTDVGVLGIPYLFRIEADNRPNFFSATGLPPGLICDGDTGLIRGTPTRAGVYSVIVKASSLYNTASEPLSILIDEGEIESASSVEGIVGVPLLYRIEANNRPNWFEASNIPPGLKFNPTLGLISGIPTKSGIYPVPVKAVNLFGSTSAAVTFTIDDGAIIGGSSPTLSMSRGADTLLLSWPAASGAFILEETELMTQTWTRSSANVSIENTNKVVAIPIPMNGTAKFYRLRK